MFAYTADGFRRIAVVPTISPATETDLDDVLPLFAGYQRFYTGTQQDDEKNRAFLTRFVTGDAGHLLIARDDETSEALGFANLYRSFISTCSSASVDENVQ